MPEETKKRRNRRSGYPISKREKQWARLLYRRGLTYEDIQKKTGISTASLSKAANDEGWKHDKNPPFTSQDIIDTLIDHTFEVLLDIRTGEEDDPSRAILDLKNLASTRRDIEELVMAVSLRNKIEVAKEIMTDLMEAGKTDGIEHIQAWHDEKVKRL